MVFVTYKDPEKQKEYMRQWMTRRRLEFFKGKSCSKCGSTTNLQLDHIDPQTKISHRIWSWSKVRRDQEIAKCQVLCYPCHKIKTVLNNERPHGERHSCSVFSETQVIEIRSRWNENMETYLRPCSSEVEQRLVTA